MYDKNFEDINNLGQEPAKQPAAGEFIAQPQPLQQDFGGYTQNTASQQESDRFFRQKQLFSEKFHTQTTEGANRVDPPDFEDFANQLDNSTNPQQPQNLPPMPTVPPQGQWVWENNNWVWKATNTPSHYASVRAVLPQPTKLHPAEENIQKTQKKNSRTGLRVFIIFMVVTLVLGFFLWGGYLLLERNTEEQDPPVSEINNEMQPPENNLIPIATRPEGVFTPAEVANRVQPSVVGITIYSVNSATNAVSEGAASGVIINEDGLILTNDHIYADFPNAQFLIVTYDGRRYDADFVGGDVRSDIALLQIRAEEGSTFVPAEFGDSDALVVGEEVIAIGTPLSITRAGSVTFGIVSATNRRERGGATAYTMNYIQTDAAINPGNSGGPLVNMQGQVIGINSWKLAAGAEGLGFSIPSRTAVSVLESLLEHGFVSGRGRLGVTFTVITPLMSRINEMPEGLQVDAIAPESNLNGKNIEQGDIITHIEGVAITVDTDFMSIIEETGAHNSINLQVLKRTTGERFGVDVVLLEDVGNSSFTE